MANPTRYQPSYSFTGWQAYNPSRPLPATNIDVEFQNLALTTDEIIAALNQIRRSDGKLFNGVVDLAALSDEVITKLGGGGGTGNVILATKAQAEAGTSNAVVMTPLRVKEAIDRFGGGGSGGDSPDAILAKLLIVDGAGSGLDADLLDGQTASFFQNAGNLNAGTVPTARLPVATSTTRGIVTVSDTAGTSGAANGVAASPLAVKAVADVVSTKQDKVTKLAGTGITDVYTKDETNAVIQDAIESGGGGTGGGSDSAIQILDKLKTVDGGGSGLDADLLDGQSGEFYREAANLTGTVVRERLPAVEKDPAYFGKADTLTDSKLFSRANQAADVHAQKLVETVSPFNGNYAGGNISALHVRHVAEGTNQNGPRGAALGTSISLFKEGFATGTAKGGEMDGIYVVLRQDSPRNANSQASPDKADGCAILADVATFDKVGFMGLLEGATSVINDSGSGVNRRLVVQLGCTDTSVGGASIGLFTSAGQGRHNAGLQVYNAENEGGYFEHMIYCGNNAGQVFGVDRRGTLSIGRLLDNGQLLNPGVHMRLQSDASLGWLNADKSVQIANLTQSGAFSVLGQLSAANISTTGNVEASGNIIAGGSMKARYIDLVPGGDPANGASGVPGRLWVGPGGALRFYNTSGQAKSVVLQ